MTAMAAVACSASPAWGSELIARNATDVRLEVNPAGTAMLSYRAKGKQHHVLAWGATNAAPSESGRRQVTFRLDYSGGWGAFRRPVWKTFANACKPVQPDLHWLVAACRAPDGSYWAVQSWQRTLPVYGMPPAPGRDAWELRLSHWSGPLPKLEVQFGWTYRRFHQIFGRLTYRGLGVYGFDHTLRGVPLDDYGRNIYVDTLQLRVRLGLASRERLPDPPADGRVLLRLLPARRPAVGPRRPLSRDGDGPGRHAGRVLGGDAAARVRSRLRSTAGHAPARAARTRSPLRAALTPRL